MTAVELLPPGTGPHDERWHELRRAGVTASEIAAILGISPYDSAFNLHWAKLNDWRWDGNEYTGVGTHLEAPVADWWMAECDPLENLAMLPAGLYAHPDRPWQLATPDRLLRLGCPGDGCDGSGTYASGRLTFECPDCDGEGGLLTALLECKWVAQSWDGWGEEGTDEVPVYYRAQALWQLDVLGVDEVHIAVLGPTGFRAYLVRRDEDDLQLMRAAGAEFVRQLEAGEAPAVDGHSATVGALRKLHPGLGDGDVQVPVELAERYRMARADRKSADERVDQCEAELRALLGSDFNRAVVGTKLVASRSIYDQFGDAAELTALEDDWPVVDRLNPGRATSYA